jgi:hypothetical protein
MSNGDVTRMAEFGTAIPLNGTHTVSIKPTNHDRLWPVSHHIHSVRYGSVVRLQETKNI